MSRTTGFMLALAAASLLAACAKSAPPPAATAAAPLPATMPRPQASVVELMASMVAPTADIIWNAVGTESTTKGTVEHKPTNDKEWATLRSQVMLLAEASNLLAVPDRAVMLPGQKFTNAPGPGDLTPEQSQAKIKANWPAFLGFARALQDSAVTALAKVDARDLDGFSEAGGAIDEACEQCHKVFWYPDAPTPP
jgi:hypothetical protein